jgi:hypothetical protein
LEQAEEITLPLLVLSLQEPLSVVATELTYIITVQLQVALVVAVTGVVAEVLVLQDKATTVVLDIELLVLMLLVAVAEAQAVQESMPYT